MKNKMILFANSLKLSVCTKPTALIMFIIILTLVTLLMSVPIRADLSSIEDDMKNDFIKLKRIDGEKGFDYANYKEIGDLFSKFCNNGLFKEDSLVCISMNTLNQTLIKSDGKEIKISETFGFVIKGYGFTKEEIDNGVNKIYVNWQVSKKYGFVDGDSVEFCGNSFTIHSLKDEKFRGKNSIYLPYTVVLKNFYYIKYGEYDEAIHKNAPLFRGGNLYLNDRARDLNKSEKEILKSFGYKEYVNTSSVWTMLFQSLYLLVPVLLASIVSIMVVNMYFQSVNKRKYAILKLLGISPKLLAGIMLTEVAVITTISAILGMLVEFVIQIFKPVGILVLTELVWLNYLLIFVATLITSLAVTGVKIRSYCKAKPVSEKFLE